MTFWRCPPAFGATLLVTLETLAKEIGFSRLAASRASDPCLGSSGNTWLVVGDQSVGYDPTCKSPATEGLNRFAATLRDISAQATPRRLPPAPNPPDCAALDRLTKKFVLSDQHGAIDLRYIAWRQRFPLSP